MPKQKHDLSFLVTNTFILVTCSLNEMNEFKARFHQNDFCLNTKIDPQPQASQWCILQFYFILEFYLLSDIIKSPLFISKQIYQIFEIFGFLCIEDSLCGLQADNLNYCFLQKLFCRQYFYTCSFNEME